MSRTGAHLKIRQLGTHAMGVVLEGNPSRPEPEHFRVSFPGGEVDIARCDDGSHWVHVTRNLTRASAPGEGLRTGRLVDGRMDVAGKHASDCDPGELKNPELYHLAIRVEVVKWANEEPISTKSKGFGWPR